MIKDNGGIIQAFPITADTYVGTPTSMVAKGYSVVHCNEAVTLIFNFGSAGIVSLAAETGQDFAFRDCNLISATGEVVLS